MNDHKRGAVVLGGQLAVRFVTDRVLKRSGCVCVCLGVCILPKSMAPLLLLQNFRFCSALLAHSLCVYLDQMSLLSKACLDVHKPFCRTDTNPQNGVCACVQTSLMLLKMLGWNLGITISDTIGVATRTPKFY